MYKSQYDIMQERNFKQISKDLSSLYMVSPESFVRTEFEEVMFLSGSTGDNISPFVVPISTTINDKKTMVIDGRYYLQKTTDKAKDPFVYDGLKYLAKMDMVWETDAQRMISLVDNTAWIWAGMTTSVLGNLYSFTEDLLVKLNFAAGAYYISMLYDENYIYTYGSRSIIDHVTRSARTNAGIMDSIVSSTLDFTYTDNETSKIYGLEDCLTLDKSERLTAIISWIAKAAEIPGLAESNITINKIQSSLGQYMWTGMNGTTFGIRAVEHPPTFIMMCIMATQKATYFKRTRAATAVDNFMSRRQGMRERIITLNKAVYNL